MPRRSSPAPTGRLVVAVVAAVAGLAILAPIAAGAPDAPETPTSVTITTLRPLPEDAGHIVSRPNSGRPPAHDGDRGGWQQTLVLVLVMAGVGVAVGLAWRDAKRRRPAAPPEEP